MAEAESVIVQAAKIKVQRTVKLTSLSAPTDEQTKESEDVLEVHQFTTTPAVAKVEIPIRMSRNYQSIGITVGVELPCYAEEIEAGIERAYQLALDRVTREIPDLKNTLDRLS